jgi:hypothetical protein
MSEFDEMFQALPHGDRICELYGNCTCGRDKEILNIKSWVFAEIARLQAIESAARELSMKWHQETGDGWRIYWKCSDALAAALNGDSHVTR